MDGVSCSGSHVTAIKWNYKGLSGSIPVEIGNLKNLTNLQLFMNTLSGPIPSSIGNLLNLDRLNLGFNQLSGSIPTQIWDLRNLFWLVLEQNQLSGSISPSIGNLINLQYLYLQNNRLTDGIPVEIGDLINLKVLDLSFNQLSGFIPSSIKNLKSLIYLGMANNNLSGPIPTDIGELTALIDLTVSFNRLNGTIPSTIERLINLRSLDLRSNQLSGAIPSIFQNMTNLQNLYLDNNQFTGSVSSSVNPINYLSLSNNQNLSATLIPSCLANVDTANTGITLSNDCIARPVLGRYIRLDYNRIECLNLAEILVYSSKNGSNIITPSTYVTKSDGIHGDVAPGKNFVDGSADTIVHTSCSSVPWIELDIGYTTNIEKIVLWNRKDCCQTRVLGTTLSILSEARAPVYISNPVKSTNMIYTWFPSSPLVVLDKLELTVSLGEKVFVPENYSLTFNIQPLGTVSSWASIVHYTQDGENYSAKSRIPAIWLIPNSLNLHVRFSTSANGNDGLDISNPLPINANTTVRVEAIGNIVAVYFNNTLQGSAILKGSRIFGEAFRYASDPWHLPAKAILSNLDMRSISTFAYSPEPNTPLSVSFPEKVFVPENYSLTFNIQPLGTVSSWASIVHYTQDGENYSAKSRIPAIWLIPNSLNLHVRFSTSANGNDGLDISNPLPINANTTVRVEAIGNIVAVYFNNTLQGSAILKGSRIFGEAFRYASDPWHLPAKAILSNLDMRSISTFAYSPEPNTPLSVSFPEKVFVPENYSLTFNIQPLGTVSSWASIVHYTQDGENYSAKSRIPAIWLIPNSLNLHVRFSTSANGNDGLDISNPLPINANTTVRVEAIGNIVAVYFNNTLQGSAILKGSRIFGEAFRYASDPWHLPAKAILSNLDMRSISTFAYSPEPNTPLSVSFPEKVFVPENYSLTFNIQPLGTVSSWASIVHYTQDGENYSAKSRIPAIWLIPNSLNLHVRFSTSANGNDGLDISNPLPINANTTVRVEAIGNIVAVYFNNTLQGSAILKGSRIFGEAFRYASDPWHLPAKAILSNLNMRTQHASFLHEIKVIIAVDNRYKLTVDGQTVPVDPRYHWGTINTHTFTVTGNGPWVVAVEGIDEGDFAGFLGAVFVDNVLKGLTGTADPAFAPFKTALNPSTGWNQSASFNDSLWSEPVVCSETRWGSWVSNFRTQNKSNASAVWLESCRKPFITAYFRAVLSV